MAPSRLEKCGFSRRAFLTGVACLVSTPALPSVIRGAGDIRKVNLINNRTGDWINTVYWIEGSFIPEALEAVSHLMRDWREDETVPIAPATIDIMGRTQALLETAEPFEVISGYRTPKTNAMLRRKSRGVARKSYHVKAMAVDLTMKSRSARHIARAAQSLNAGGVGRYTRAKFVHLDSGPVRDWGR
ncbi:MAG: DUF882 domain-containing protein [Pseudomonadota bacterium]